MKKLILLIAMLVLTQVSNSQINLLKKEALKQVEKNLKEAFEGDKAKQEKEKKDKLEKEKKDKLEKEKKDKLEKERIEKEKKLMADKTKKTVIDSPSKFDFIPGEKAVFYDDFTEDRVGEFPGRWDTHGFGEIVTFSGQAGKWLKMKNASAYKPEILRAFPENYTIEFDMIVSGRTDGATEWAGMFNLVILKDDGTKDYLSHPNVSTDGNRSYCALKAKLSNREASRFTAENWAEQGDAGVHIETADKSLANGFNMPQHVAISVNRLRYRLWVNDHKILDLPRFMVKECKYNVFMFGLWGFAEDEEAMSYVAITNYRFAETGADTWSKLITEGRYITSGITFEDGTERIKATSFGILKEIATLLKDNPKVNIKIIGHTDVNDNSGNKEINNILSSKRAAAIKSSLVKDFGIDASRMITMGKGALQPVNKNSTIEDRANNRRLEFVKM